MHRKANIFKTKVAAARRKRKGFTLIELVVVIAIIATLVSLIAPNLIGYLGQADDTKGQAAAKSVYTAVVAKNAAGQIKPLGKNVDIKLNSGTLANYLNSREVEDIQSTSGGTTKAATATVCVGDDGVVKAVRVMFGDGEDTKTYYYPEGSDSLFGEASVDADEESGDGGEAAVATSGIYKGGTLVMSWQELGDGEYITTPENYSGYTTYGMQGNASLKSLDFDKIVIDSNVTFLGDYAFSGHSQLTEIVIPSSVTQIGAQAFRGTSLSSVNIPASVKTIGSSCFDDVTTLSTLTLHEGLEYIGDYAFEGTSIKTVVIPSSVTYLGRYAFGGSTAQELESITINANIEEIKPYTFDGQKLKSVEINCPSLKVVGERAFFRDSSVLATELNITIPSTVTSIGNSAFDSNTVVHYSGSAAGSPWGAKSVVP